MVTLCAALPAAQRSRASCSTSLSGDGASVVGAIVTSLKSGSGGRTTGSGAGCRATGGVGAGAAAGANVGAGISVKTGSAAGASATIGIAANERGAVIRSNSPVTIRPLMRSSVASVAISTIGTFFG